MDTSAYISSGILESYVLNQLSEEENAEIKAIALKYPEVRAEIFSIEETLESYFLDASTKIPPPHLKNKIASRLQFKEEASKEIPIVNNPKNKFQVSAYWLVAASVALIISIVYIFMLQEELTEKKDQLISVELDRQYFASQFESQKQAYEDVNRHLAIATQKSNKTILLRGLENAPQAIGSIYWNLSSKEVYLNIRDLPAPPSDKQYQLWAIVNGKPVDAGVFDLSFASNASLLQKMKPITDAQAFAITLEKKGGSLVPTLNAMYLLGNV